MLWRGWNRVLLRGWNGVLLRGWNRVRSQFALWFTVGLCLSFLAACSAAMPTVDSPESATKVLQEDMLPKINVRDAYVPDEIAARYTTDNISEPLPNIEEFPLHAAQPSADADIQYVEIFSSSEKANIDKQNERWLVEVADAFNDQRLTTSSGKTIQIGVRQVASGTAARLLTAGTVQPEGYSPSNDLWVSMIQSEGVNATPVVERLVPNTAGWVVADAAYQDMAASGEVNFEAILAKTLSGELTIGYPNPYASSTALNLLHTLFWRAAGHQENGQLLTVADLESPQVNSTFTAFQDQVLLTALTTLDLQEIFIRDQQVLEAFPLEYQNFQSLTQLPGFESVHFVPFGMPHNNPLVGFDWNTPEEQEALQKFGEFATSSAMQQLAQQQGFEVTDHLQQANLPPTPSGEVLQAAQSYWKLRKDGGRTVYMMLAVDTSGSMMGEPLQAVQEGLKIASSQINPGNYVGMVTFGDRTERRLSLAPFDPNQHRRFLAAIDNLSADGRTAMYDATMIAMSDLLDAQAKDPNGRFYLLLLTDGEANEGFNFNDVKGVLTHSGIRVYPIAYGDVNQQELQDIASLRESTVKTGTPENVQDLLKGIFQTNL